MTDEKRDIKRLSKGGENNQDSEQSHESSSTQSKPERKTDAERMLSSSRFYTRLHQAVVFGTLDEIRKEVEEASNKVSGKRQDHGLEGRMVCGGLNGATPLHLAAYMNSPEKTALLLELGANFNAIAGSNKMWFTPLDLTEDAEIKTLLRAHGAKTGEELRAEQG